MGSREGPRCSQPLHVPRRLAPAASGGPAIVVTQNHAYERAAKRTDVKFITIDNYRSFRDVGLQGLGIDGAERPDARDRNGTRNACSPTSSSRPASGASNVTIRILLGCC